MVFKSFYGSTQKPFNGFLKLEFLTYFQWKYAYSNSGLKHWQVVKHILKYLRRMRDYMLVYHSEDLIPIGYIDSDFLVKS